MAQLGHGTQIVKVLGDHSYQLDEKALEQVLMKEAIRDLPVVVVSVAGAYRGGKSFLLNFFIRYLTSSQQSREDGTWIGEQSMPLTGFDWRGGVQRNTTGILLWSEPFITTLPSGEKVAVLLMDTQGTFDNTSTVRDNSTIFALSTLISSVQIYNLSMNIQEDDLQHLQLFTMYGKMVQEKEHGGKAFQILEFLVRDWPYPYDYPFGAEGGNQLLQERLEIYEDQPKELREIRTHVRSSFDKVLCFLMPHPGFKVQNPKYKGNISDVEPNFIIHLKELVSTSLSLEKLCPKTINGQKVKAGDLFNYFKTYVTLFNSDKIPNPTSIMQATAEAGLLSSANEAREVYEKGMDSECGPTQPSVPAGDVQELHNKYLAAARSAFMDKKTMATQEEVNKYMDRLNKELQNRLPQFEQSNLSKLQAVIKNASDAYEVVIQNISKHQPLCLHLQDLETVHSEAVRAAMTTYDGSVKKISNKPDQKRVELNQDLENRHVQLKMTNDKNNKDAVKDLQTEYWTFMETKSVNPPISDEDFKRGHEAGLNQALVKFQAKRNRPNSYPNDIYKEDLIKTVTDAFERLQAINHRKIEQERIRQEQERRRIEQERLKAEQERIRIEQETRAREQETIRIQQEMEKVEQERRRVELENERLRIERERRRSRSRGKCVIM